MIKPRKVFGLWDTIELEPGLLLIGIHPWVILIDL